MRDIFFNEISKVYRHALFAALVIRSDSISKRSYLGNIIRSLAMFQVQRNSWKVTSKRRAELKLLCFDLGKAFDTIDHRLNFRSES